LKILIGIITANHVSRAPYIDIQRNDLFESPLNYVFVFGNGKSPKFKMIDSLSVPCDDTRPYMVLKNQALFRYALDQGYDFCFRICDDTRVFPERLQEAHLESYDYAGNMTAKIQAGPVKIPMRYLDYMNGGCGIWLSRKAMQMLVDDEWKGPIRKFPDNLDMGFGLHLNMEPWDWDDRWIGEMLKGNLAWDDPKRVNAFQAYVLNGINVYENDLLFFNDDPNLPVSIHDPGRAKISGIKTAQEWEEMKKGATL